MPKEEKFDPKVVQAWRKEVREAKGDLSEINDLTSVLNGRIRDLSPHQIRQNKHLSTTLSLSIKAAKEGKISLDQLKSRAKIIEDIASGQDDISSISGKQRDIEDEMLLNTKKYWGKNKKIGEQKNRELTKDLEILDAEKNRLRAQEASNRALDGMDDLTGGMVGHARTFVEEWKSMGPHVALTAAAVTAMVGILMLVEAILGPIWAWLFINETPPPIVIIGGAIIIFSILFQTFFARKA